MDTEFPSNSQRAQKEEPKKVEKVVVGEVIRRKPTLGKRLANTFFGGDAHGVMGYVFLDVLVPAVKDLVVDMVSTGIERAIFGEGRGGLRSRGGYRPSGSSGYTQYNRYSSPIGSARREEPREREISRRGRAEHKFDEIVLATRVEAEEVINRLFDLVNQYGEATVYDFLELVGISGNFADKKWGWTDVRGSTWRKVRDGYLLDLPPTESLKS
jgi:hypothetical protein